MAIHLWIPYMLVSMTLTLMQGRNVSAKTTNQRCMLSATKQAINKHKLAATVGQFLCDLDFVNVYVWIYHMLFLITF